MGVGHSTMGAIAGVVSVPDGLGVGEQVAWVVLWTTAALWADFDSTQSSAARTFGPLTQSAGGIVGRLVGGHRWGTHDVVLAPLAIYYVIVPLAMATVWSRYLLVGLLLGLALRTFLPRSSTSDLSNLLCSIGGAWWIVAHNYDQRLPVAGILAAGVIVHCVGDLPTPEGLPVPVLWLVSRRFRFCLPLFSVGGLVEKWLVGPVLNLVLVLVMNQRFSWLNLPIPVRLFRDGVMPLPLPF